MANQAGLRKTVEDAVRSALAEPLRAIDANTERLEKERAHALEALKLLAEAVGEVELGDMRHMDLHRPWQAACKTIAFLEASDG